MAKFKIDRMHALFGAHQGAACKDCGYYRSYEYRGKKYRKCAIYGITNSEASDWRASYIACGLFPDRPYHGETDVITMRDRDEEKPLEGQTTIFDFLEE